MVTFFLSSPSYRFPRGVETLVYTRLGLWGPREPLWAEAGSFSLVREASAVLEACRPQCQLEG